MKRPWIEHGDKYIVIHSKRNHAKFIVGKGTEHGFLMGIQWHKDFYWWHLAFGVTILFWYVSLNFRWRVFDCQ